MLNLINSSIVAFATHKRNNKKNIFLFNQIGRAYSRLPNQIKRFILLLLTFEQMPKRYLKN